MLKIDDTSYTADPITVFWNEQADLIVGKYCSFGNNITVFLGGNHRTDWVSTYPFDPGAKGHPATKGNVIIGNDVWVGHGATIMSGVTIGNGACVGALSVVTKDIPAYTITAGNPARVRRYRFSPTNIERLEKLAWWDWPKDKIKEAIPYLQENDVNNFLLRFE